MLGVLGGDSDAYDSKTNLATIGIGLFSLRLNVVRLQHRAQTKIKF